MSLSRENLKVRSVSNFTAQGTRPGQEDHLLVDQEKGIFVIADGFGGPIPGNQAAKVACEAIRSFLFKEAGDRDATFPFVLRRYFSLAGNILFNALIHANRKLVLLNKDQNVHERGGSSVLAGYLDGDLLAIANVGICNSWLFRKGSAANLVIPRSFGQLCNPFLKDTPEELRVPLMAVPLIALGMYDDLEPEIVEYRVKQNDWLVIATDGISSDIQEKLLAVQQMQLPPDQSAKEIDLVLNTCTFQDNAAISIIMF